MNKYTSNFVRHYPNALMLFAYKVLQQKGGTMGTNLEQVREKLFSAKNKTQTVDDLIRKEYFELQQQKLKRLNPSLSNELEAEEKYTEIADFIKEHVLAAGKEQAVKDFQAGLNFLHIDLKDFIKEDGDFGNNTFNAFYEICKFYNIEVIKEAIRKGAISNAVINTTIDPKINTDYLVDTINQNLNTTKEVI